MIGWGSTSSRIVVLAKSDLPPSDSASLLTDSRSSPDTRLKVESCSLFSRKWSLGSYVIALEEYSVPGLVHIVDDDAAFRRRLNVV